MPIEYIRKWLFDSEMKKPMSISNETSNAIGVYMLHNKEDNQIEQLKKQILSQGVKTDEISILLFANQKEALVSEEKNYTQKDIKWAGYPQGETINKFITKKYKRFYYLCPTMDAHQYFILSKINADFKAGVYSKGIENLLDLTIDNAFVSPTKSLQDIYTTITKLRNKNNDSK